MKLSILLLSSLASMVIGQPIHEHHQHKREADADAGVQVVTVYATQVVTQGVDRAAVPGSSYSYTQSGSSFSAVLQSSTEAAVSSSTGAAASSEATSSTTTLLSSSTQGGSASSTASESSSTASASGNSTSAKGAKGITYSPYTSSGTCKDSATIKSDIKLLSDFDIIRLYDTDCSGVENVLSAKTSSQKLFAGIYYISKIQASVDIIAAAVKNVDNGWDNIYTVSIGNELVNAGSATTAEIKAAIDTTRTALTSAGYSGKVVSVDTLVAVQNNAALCEYSDYIAVNSHPFWDGNTAASGSGEFLKTQIANIKSICGGKKDVLITETGWPTKGSDYKNAVPSVANQEIALQSIVDTVGDQVILFTTYNDLWKSPGDYGVEQYWGIISQA